MKILFITTLVLWVSLSTSAQVGYEHTDKMKVLYSSVFDGDTIPYINIPEVNIIGQTFANNNDRNLYEYYLKRVKKVYPYFEIAKTVIEDLEYEQENSKKRQFKKYKKNKKQELMNAFEKELRALKVSEGKVLVKMINRSTGSNFIDVIKEYNGFIKVWAYNIAANRYDYDLKEAYDPMIEENRMLERAIQTVEQNYKTNESKALNAPPLD
jgi:hypothetical protein